MSPRPVAASGVMEPAQRACLPVVRWSTPENGAASDLVRVLLLSSNGGNGYFRCQRDHHHHHHRHQHHVMIKVLVGIVGITTTIIVIIIITIAWVLGHSQK